MKRKKQDQVIKKPTVLKRGSGFITFSEIEIIPLDLIKTWIRDCIITEKNIHIPTMENVDIIQEELKFSSLRNNIQIRLVPRKCCTNNIKLVNYT